MSEQTSWPRVGAYFLAGLTGAFLVGKASAVLPLLRGELELSLLQAGLVVSMFSLIAAAGGVMFGALADRFGYVRMGLTGMGLAVAGGLSGAFVNSAELLLATRIAEGAGFFLATVSMPALMLRTASGADRQKVMGFWGSYMPAGTAIMMLCGGLLADHIGWRGVWILTAGLIFLAMLAVGAAARSRPERPPPSLSLAGAMKTARYKGPVLLAIIFAAYAGQYLAVTAFIPLILVEQADWTIAGASMAGAAIIFCNVFGNLASGPVLDAGLRRRDAILLATAAMAIGAALLLSDGLPIPVRLGGGFLFSLCGGLIPGALFSAAPVHSPAPNLISTVNGLMLQGSAIGQVLLPSLVSWYVGITGMWASALAVTMPGALIVVIAAFALDQIEMPSKASAR